MILFLTRMASSPGRALTRLRSSGLRLKSTKLPPAETEKYSGPSIKFTPTGGATRVNEPAKEGAFVSTGNASGIVYGVAFSWVIGSLYLSFQETMGLGRFVGFYENKAYSSEPDSGFFTAGFGSKVEDMKNREDFQGKFRLARRDVGSRLPKLMAAVGADM